MKSIDSSLQSHLNGEVTTLATCWKIIRSDNTTLGFTDHDENIVYDGVTYEASTGISPSSIRATANTSVDNLDILGVLDSSGITDADILSQKYDNADIYIFMVNYNDVTMGDIKLSRGKIGEIEVRDNTYLAEFRSLKQLLQQRIGEKYSRKCRADLGDTRCGVDLEGSPSFTFTGQVDSVVDRANFTCDLTNSAGYFDFGKITWTSGNNNTYAMEVKAYTRPGSPEVATIELNQKMPFDIQAGDTFSIYAGCDKTTSTCKNKFNNIVNFRGEPFIPGQDEILQFGGQ